jgi:TRAP-type C4-dicarboxylate transport system substrate-binding protein
VRSLDDVKGMRIRVQQSEYARAGRESAIAQLIERIRKVE